jgi:hypothetical protein
MATRHLSIRIDDEVLNRLDSAARDHNETRSDLAKRLIDEGLRMAQHPGVYFVTGPAGRRATLMRGPDVWEVVRAIRYMDLPTDDAVLVLAQDVIIARAQAEERVIVTENVDDFRRLLTERLSGHRSHHGVVLVNSRSYPRHDPRTIGRMVTALEALLVENPDLQDSERWLPDPS